MRIGPIYRREMAAYFATPLAYVFIVIFLVLTGVFTFYPGGFFERGQADLVPFFTWFPWLFLFLAPALGMRLWAEELRTGTFEVLLTLPIPMADAVLGKFLAAWTMMAVSMALTFPVWITVNVLGDPDNGTILAGYLGSLLMAAAYLSVSAAVSAVTRNQVIAFIVSAAACFAFLLAGFPLVQDALGAVLPEAAAAAIGSMGFLFHFENIVGGVLDLRDVLFFVTFTAVWLYAGAWAVDHHRS